MFVCVCVCVCVCGQIREITAAEFKSSTPTGSNGTILASELRYNLLLLQQEAMDEVEVLAVALRKQENQLQQLRNESQALQKQLLKRQKGIFLTPCMCVY